MAHLSILLVYVFAFISCGAFALRSLHRIGLKTNIHYGRMEESICHHPSISSNFANNTELHYVYKTEIMKVPTDSFFKVVDITPKIREFITKAGIKEGTAHILARHTTTAITINEFESQLVKDMETQMMNHLHHLLHLPFFIIHLCFCLLMQSVS